MKIKKVVYPLGWYQKKKREGRALGFGVPGIYNGVSWGIHLGEDIRVSMELLAASKKLERWQFIHHIYNSNDDLAAEVKVYGAWIDLNKRKLTGIPEKYQKLIQTVPKSNDFKVLPLKEKA